MGTKTQKTLEHSYTAHDDQPFTVQELVLLKSVALAKFENKVGKNPGWCWILNLDKIALC